jgi:hypothetical protein
VDVVDIAVAVVVRAVAGDLAGINPEIAVEVGVVELRAAVDDRDEDVGTGLVVPGRLTVHVLGREVPLRAPLRIVRRVAVADHAVGPALLDGDQRVVLEDRRGNVGEPVAERDEVDAIEAELLEQLRITMAVRRVREGAMEPDRFVRLIERVDLGDAARGPAEAFVPLDQRDPPRDLQHQVMVELHRAAGTDPRRGGRTAGHEGRGRDAEEERGRDPQRPRAMHRWESQKTGQIRPRLARDHERRVATLQYVKVARSMKRRGGTRAARRGREMKRAGRFRDRPVTGPKSSSGLADHCSDAPMSTRPFCTRVAP